MAIAQLMKYLNSLSELKPELGGTAAFHQSLVTLCTLLAPMAPHVTSELMSELSAAVGDNTLKASVRKCYYGGLAKKI